MKPLKVTKENEINTRKAVVVESLEDAYAKKLFTGGVSTERFLKYLASKIDGVEAKRSKDYMGLFNTYYSKFICTLPNLSRLPQFTLQLPDGKVLCKSFRSTIKSLRGDNYEIGSDYDIYSASV